MIKVKICGLSRELDILAVNKYKPDYVGFVFAPQSRRYVTPEKAAELRKMLSADILAVGVFVNEPIQNIADLLNKNIINIPQLHGQETESDIQWLKAQTGRPVIKAVSVQVKSDIIRWADSQADYLLLDHGAGGTGKSFDWSLSESCPKPFFLAGGINLDNLCQALTQGAYAVDISSGAETGPYKDPEKIARIIEIVRSVHTIKRNNRKES